jgi:hypothetical protein
VIKASEDWVRVMVDYGMAKTKKKRDKVDTGLFKRIYRSKVSFFVFKRVENGEEQGGDRFEV